MYNTRNLELYKPVFKAEGCENIVVRILNRVDPVCLGVLWEENVALSMQLHRSGDVEGGIYPAPILPLRHTLLWIILDYHLVGSNGEVLGGNMSAHFMCMGVNKSHPV